MDQPHITNFFRTKRKYTPDGVLVRKKVILIERDGCITPEKCDSEVIEEPAKRRSTNVSRILFGAQLSSESVEVPFQSASSIETKNGDDTKPPINVEEPRKELSLGNVKKALSKSSRLNGIKSRISKFNESYEKLKGLESVKKNIENRSLKEFHSIELEVPVSPIKQSPCKPSSPFKSPVKSGSFSLGSPLKSPSKVAAYLRFDSLVSTTPSLTLPHHYRLLAEIFRAVETTAAILYNRRETITFAKIKSSAQEMLKRNITEYQLSQINYLSPYMYKFIREKVKSFNGFSKVEYELVLIPQIISQKTGSPLDMLTPEATLERRRRFYNLLVEQVKIHHEKFLLSLDPPLVIPKSKLLRWHPEFDLERIPDIEAEPLPEIPNVERFTTAENVLSKAKEMFQNPRIQKALEKLAESKVQSKTDIINEVKESFEPVNPALKNIPVCLLQKVKARQAEKALKAMTSVHSENFVAYQKLPDLARTVRNLFVSLKKSVLPVDVLIPKLENSFSVKLSTEEYLRHFKLLSKEVPEWLTLIQCRKSEFIKLNKVQDFTKVISKLEALADKYNE